MPEVIRHLIENTHLTPIRWYDPSQWKYVKIAASRKQNHKQNCKEETRDSISDDYYRASPNIEVTAISYRFNEDKRKRKQKGLGGMET